MSSDTKHIFQSLAVNVSIAIAKGIAAFFTGSGSMLAETIHSSADCANQLLLLIGVTRARAKPDDSHPLGYGRSLYFWSFIVSLLLFSGGGVFSIYEGIHKMSHPEPVEHVWLGFAILGFSLAMEGWATWGNLKEMKVRRGETPLFKYLQQTKDSDLVVVFGENAAAVVGLIFAIASLFLAWQLNEPRWDAVGSLLIGVVLVCVAIFLGREITSLLLGERADPKIELTVHQVAKESKNIEEVLRIITLQQGPGEVVVACKVRVSDGLSAREAIDAINAFEKTIRERCPEVKWSFVEPDYAP